MSQSHRPVPAPGAPQGGSGLATLPAIWVGVNVLLAGYGLWSGWWLLGEYDIPDSALYLIHAGVAANIVNLLWGLGLVGLAVGGSAIFPRHFIVWQVVNIAWIALRQAYVLMTPDFVVTLMPLLYAAAEIAVGVACIQLLRRPGTATAYSAETERPAVIVSIIAALLGIVIGGAIGFGIGLGSGAAIAEATDMSCFEGACGYFAFFLGLGGVLVGAIAGAILAVWLVNRRRPARTA